MYLKLIRNKANGSAITGRLVIDGRWFCNTLERKGYEILALFYPVKVTQSPKFKRLLPIVNNVPRALPAFTEDSAHESQSGPPRSSWLSGERRNGGNLNEQSEFFVASPFRRRSGGNILRSTSTNDSEPYKINKISAPQGQGGYRSGIRFHVGTRPEHSTGCILVPNRAIEKELTDLILKAQNAHEEIILEVIDFTPGTEYGYNHPCPPELQKP